MTPSQSLTLLHIADHGPATSEIISKPADVKRGRKYTLNWHVCTYATLRRLHEAGYVSVSGGDWVRPKDAAGRAGHPRRAIKIEITDAGRAALAAEYPKHHEHGMPPAD